MIDCSISSSHMSFGYSKPISLRDRNVSTSTYVEYFFFDGDIYKESFSFGINKH